MATKLPSTASRPFRIFALPLARLPKPFPSSPLPPNPNPSANSDNASQPKKPQTPLMLFQISQPDPPPNQPGDLRSIEGLTNRALQKASDTWMKLGEKDPKSWMFWFYKRGEGLMDRIEYEEWSLKGISEGRGVRVVKEGEGEAQEMIEISLLKPSLSDQPLPTLLPKLHRMLIHRIPYHRKMLVRSLIAAPLTTPFALIPVVPNFPLFYVLWRAWSHYKAYRGATYLEQLLKLGMINEKESKELTDVYGARRIAGSGEKEGAPGQAKGMDAAPDGTATPSAMTYESSSASTDSTSTQPSTSTSSSNSTSTTPTPTQSQSQPQSQTNTNDPQTQNTNANETKNPQPKIEPSTPPQSRPSPNSSSPQIHHPNLLLTSDGVQKIAQVFALKPAEVLDMNRAVEQAGLRAKKADEERAGGAVSGGEAQQGAVGGQSEGKGTEWRGNLHR